jgi:drug/metabolite transporter (DMT)-like permease
MGRPAVSLPPVSRSYVPLLLVLGAIWGASFMFIKVADRELAPTTMMAGRTGIGAVLLLAFLAARVGFREAVGEVRRLGRRGFVLGVVNAAVPFTLIAWGEKHVDSGVAAIANATVPIFIALLAFRFLRSERARGLQLVGIVIGLAGVAVLAGVHPRGGWWAVAGTLAVVGAAVAYAIGGMYVQHLTAHASPLALTTASLLGAALALLPFGVAQLPGSVPGWKVIGSVVALGIAGTAVGQLIYYCMIETDGSARASLVTYLLPVTALFYGAGLLGEPITAEEIAGLVLILIGTTLGSGAVRFARREPAPA